MEETGSLLELLYTVKFQFVLLLVADDISKTNQDVLRGFIYHNQELKWRQPEMVDRAATEANSFWKIEHKLSREIDRSNDINI